MLGARFSDFERMKLAFTFLKNPFNFDLAEAKKLSILLGIDKAALENDLVKILSLDEIKTKKVTLMWLNLFDQHEFEVINLVVAKLLSIFGSTYVCESAFSNLKYRKSKCRSQITDENLEAEMRCSATNFTPNFKELVKQKICRKSN